jgi:P27 family predicted phage terminase small subunit
MRGRKPTPTHLKLVTGNPGRRKLNAKEPIAFGDLFYPPDYFDDALKEDWAYAIQHAPKGMLKKIERTTLEVFVVASNTLRRAILAQRKIDAGKELPFLTKTPNGMAIQSPYLGIISKQSAIILKAAAELGFTPSARSRITLDRSGEGETKDPLDEALGR